MKKLVLVAVCVCFAVSMMVTFAAAKSSYVKLVNTTCGTNYNCGTCHIDTKGGGPLTATGLKFQSGGDKACALCPTASACGPACVKTARTEKGLCSDGIDNDCDGKTDLADTRDCP